MQNRVEEDSRGDWLEWFALRAEYCEAERRGRRVYVPSPAEIESRKVDTRWLYSLGFPACFVASVMEHDSPNIERVRTLVARHGVEETLRRCRSFLVGSEYCSRCGRCEL